MGDLFETVGSGGPILLVLALLSVVSLTLIVMKWLELRSVLSGEEGRSSALSLWTKSKQAEAQKAVGEASPADRLLTFSMKGLVSGLPPCLASVRD